MHEREGGRQRPAGRVPATSEEPGGSWRISGRAHGPARSAVGAASRPGAGGARGGGEYSV